MILDNIFENRAKQVAAQKESCPFSIIERLAFDFASTHDTIDFAAALKRDYVCVIAEVKKASPSKGLIRESFDPVCIAKAYESAGAAAISVLTEETYFQGSAHYLEEIRRVVNLPLLRKDFIFDEWQICEARLIGADAVLLIAAMLETERLKELLSYASSLGLQALVETHNEKEVAAATDAGAKIFGVNNRNLADFNVDISCAEKLSKLIPSGSVFVAESGITSKADVKRMRDAGADAVLVGESLMRAASIEEKLNEFKVNKNG
jgi:indole-3-glycerol phosphate synthase